MNFCLKNWFKMTWVNPGSQKGNIKKLKYTLFPLYHLTSLACFKITKEIKVSSSSTKNFS